MAIIPLGPLTIPSIRKLLINRPGLPGGRFCGVDPPPLVSLPNSGAKGSRRTVFSRTATGFMTGTATGVGTSGFAAVTNLDLGAFLVELPAGPGEISLLREPDGLMAPAVPSAGFGPGVTLEAGFTAGVLAGLALAFAVAGAAGEPGAEPGAGLGVAGGLTAEFVGGAGFGVCGFGAAVPAGAAWLAGALFAPAAALAGAG